MDDSDMTSTSSLLSAIRTFTSSSRPFQVLHTIGSHTSTHPSTLYILDASFNPPTLAHLRLCCSALLNDTRRKSGSSRLLLLLATQNADKPPKPAGFEHRLAMMCSLAQDVRSQIEEGAGRRSQGEDIAVDVGVVKTPLFINKVEAIASSGVYSETASDAEPQQVHLIGFDTLLRLLDPQYYPGKTLRSLEVLFGRHRVRVTGRAQDKWGDQEKQMEFVQQLAHGIKDEEGFKREWTHNLELVDGRRADDEAVSSTKVREAVMHEDSTILEHLITSGVRDHITKEMLYRKETS